ncbi:MAG TPA: nodulation protein NfeD [Dehalococcoidia bacterium]|nr:nodulation protein NfeD [Dehalococcoidia bacterium]
MSRGRRWRLALFTGILIAGVLTACSRTVHERNAVHILGADAEVNPVLARYIDRGIDEGERTDARAVVIELNTPGGLSDSMESIVRRIESARVPVIVWVAPSGAKAASAGTFITMSAHIAAMAPGTSIGAAHPIDASGGDIGGTLGEKVENNAAAYARSIAETRGRNADWAERAVRDSISASTNDAVDQHVVDFSASSLDDLLRQSDGRTVTVDGRQVTLAGLADAPRVTNSMTFVERLLLVLSDPNIAFLLLSLGGLGLLIELLHPGVFFPGVFGAIALVLAFFALGTLPVNWAGVALILLAFALFAGEAFAPGFGALGVGGAVSLIAGGLLLTSTSNPDFQVSRWLVIVTGVVFAAFFTMVVFTVWRVRRMPPALGVQAMVGRAAVARSDLDPQGFVFLQGERWKAVAEDAPVQRGEHVTVTGVQGLTLSVRRRAAQAPDTAPKAT